MQKSFDIIGFGACAVDDLLYVDEFPQPGGKTRVVDRVRAGGGLAATALVAAVRLGASAAFCGSLGYDEQSIYSIDELRREGIDVSLIRRTDAARPHYSVIIVERGTGERSILASNEGIQGYPVELIDRELIGSCRALFVDHNFAASAFRAASLAREMGIPVVADVERFDAEGLAVLIPLVDHLIVSRNTAALLSGEAEPEDMVQVLSGGRAVTVVTAGARGSWYLEAGGEVRHQAAFPVEVVDTTGCGDVFHGAYLAALVRGLSADKCVAFASAAAALKATGRGGRAAIPDRTRVEALISAAKIL